MIPKCKDCNCKGLYVIFLAAALFVGMFVGCNWCRFCSTCCAAKDKKKVVKVIPSKPRTERAKTYDAI